MKDLVWKINRFRQTFHHHKGIRVLCFTVQNILLGFFISTYSASKLPLIPTSIEQFVLMWKADGFLGLWVSGLFSLAIVYWFPIDADPVVHAARLSAAEKVPSFFKGAKSLEKVLSDLDKVEKGRSK